MFLRAGVNQHKAGEPVCCPAWGPLMPSSWQVNGTKVKAHPWVISLLKAPSDSVAHRAKSGGGLYG